MAKKKTAKKKTDKRSVKADVEILVLVEEETCNPDVLMLQSGEYPTDRQPIVKTKTFAVCNIPDYLRTALGKKPWTVIADAP